MYVRIAEQGLLLGWSGLRAIVKRRGGCKDLFLRFGTRHARAHIHTHYAHAHTRKHTDTYTHKHTCCSTVGPRGPILLEDYHLVEKLAQFDRERIPERVVHARGSVAKGFFEVGELDLCVDVGVGRRGFDRNGGEVAKGKVACLHILFEGSLRDVQLKSMISS